MMQTTRIILRTDNDLYTPKYNDALAFLSYFNLPNSAITMVDDDGVSLKSEGDSESDKQTLSDIEDSRSTEPVYETFFSELSHKFSKFNELSVEELQSEVFLETCEEYFSIVDKFNSPVFAPMKADVNGNITKLRRKISQNPVKFRTLFAIVTDEIESQTTQARNSATDALLWLKRAFEFVSGFLYHFGMGDKTLLDAVNKGYEQSLKPHHGLLARSGFSLALRVVPNNEEFLRSLAIHPNDAFDPLFQQQIFSEMLDHALDMSSAFQKITLFYTKHGLEPIKKVA